LKLLLDTNVFIWASVEPVRLTASAKEAILEPGNERFVSLASLWEMQIKHGLGKLPLAGQVELVGRAWCHALAAEILTVELSHLAGLYRLPPLHKDPFDRMIIAQALVEGMELVSADEVFRSYPVPVVW